MSRNLDIFPQNRKRGRYCYYKTASKDVGHKYDGYGTVLPNVGRSATPGQCDRSLMRRTTRTVDRRLARVRGVPGRGQQLLSQISCAPLLVPAARRTKSGRLRVYDSLLHVCQPSAPQQDRVIVVPREPGRQLPVLRWPSFQPQRAIVATAAFRANAIRIPKNNIVTIIIVFGRRTTARDFDERSAGI